MVAFGGWGSGLGCHAQERKELAGRVRARQTGTLAPSPLKRWMSPSLIERNFQCAYRMHKRVLCCACACKHLRSRAGWASGLNQPRLQVEASTSGWQLMCSGPSNLKG